MIEEWLAVIVGVAGILVGWWLNQLSHYLHSRKERAEKRLAMYQQALGQVSRLQDRLDRYIGLEQVSTEVEYFKQWWYLNSMALDESTNGAIASVIDRIMDKITPKNPEEVIEGKGNLLLNQAIKEAFEAAEYTIKANAEPPKRTLRSRLG